MHMWLFSEKNLDLLRRHSTPSSAGDSPCVRTFNSSEAAALKTLQAYSRKPEWLQLDVSPRTVGILGELLGARGACHGAFAAIIDGREAIVKSVAAAG